MHFHVNPCPLNVGSFPGIQTCQAGRNVYDFSVLSFRQHMNATGSLFTTSFVFKFQDFVGNAVLSSHYFDDSRS